MKDSTKTFIASIIIFACSLGFFIGAFAFNNSGSFCTSKTATCCSKKGICESRIGEAGDCCKKQGNCCKKKLDCCKRHHGEFRGEGPHHGQHFHHGEQPRDPHFMGEHFKGDRFKDGKKFDKKFDFKKGAAFMDSVLQVTHEQKAALEQQRKLMDSTFKVLRKQKKEAEKALREALDANDDKKIAAAFCIPYAEAHSNDEVKTKFDEIMKSSGFAILEIFVSPEQFFEPKNTARKLDDGTLISAPLEDLAPFLPREELKANMFIKMLEQ